MRIAQSHFPWEPSILDGGDWGCAGASVMSTDSDNVSSGLCHSGGDNSYAGTRNQFHPDPRAWIYRAQVIDQLCQILDAVDIVMRRRRDQHHFRHSVPQACDVDAHFAGWQLTAFARLSALRNLDFQFVRVNQIFGSHSKSG